MTTLRRLVLLLPLVAGACNSDLYKGVGDLINFGADYRVLDLTVVDLAIVDRAVSDHRADAGDAH